MNESLSRPLTRRRFLQSAAAFPFAMQSLAQVRSVAGVHDFRWLLLGTQNGQGVYRASWNPATGVMGAAELAAPTLRPTFFATHPSLPLLYAANEGDPKTAAVSVFHVDHKLGRVKHLRSVPSGGAGSCYVSVDSTGAALLVANYTGGSVAAIPLDAGGVPEFGIVSIPQITADPRFVPPTAGLRSSTRMTVYDCHKTDFCGPTGPVAGRQDAPHLHCAVFSPGNSYALVCDLGDDAILVFGPDITAALDMRSPLRVAARPGSGPRHVLFHPNGRWVYCINELDCSLDLYDWGTEGRQSTLTRRDGATVSTLAPGTPLTGNTAAEVQVSPDGHFLYACTRGENSATVYAVDPTSGTLREIQRVSCGGTTPRYMTLDPSGKWLLFANQGSSNVTVFARDPKTGRIGKGPGIFAADSPMCIAFA